MYDVFLYHRGGRREPIARNVATVEQATAAAMPIRDAAGRLVAWPLICPAAEPHEPSGS
jgi:hypothetical protein